MAIDHKKIFKIFVVVLISLYLGFGIFSAGTFYILYGVMDKYYYFIASFVAVNGSMTMCLISFVLLLHSIYMRFDLINLCIKKNFATQEEEIENCYQKPSKSLSKLVMKLAEMHDSLADVTDRVNFCFAFQMLNIVGSLFCNNLFSTFAIYRVFVREDFQHLYTSSVHFAWNVYFMSFAFVIIALSSLMTRTGKFTAVLVHKAINYVEVEDDPIIDYVRYFNYYYQPNILIRSFFIS